MKYSRSCVASVLFAVASGIAYAAPLPQLNIDKSQTTVSGVSSGGYMAVQLHVAYSAIFRKGAGIVAGGPYNCAEGQLANVGTRCLGKTPIPVDDLVAITGKWEKEGLIDPTSNLSASKAYIFSGANDNVVREATGTALLNYYRNYLPAANIVHKKDVAAGHSLATDDAAAAPCATFASPYIVNCNFDLAGAVLQHLYGSLVARKNGTLDGSLVEFEQSPFGIGHGLGTTGWVYIPKSCADGANCRLHVALHGCVQNASFVGDAFARHAGYNRWADTNNMVVLYPQTGMGAFTGCWDWWGYDDANHAKKSAPQMSAIVAMLEHLSRSPTPAKTSPAPALVR